jgi:hypothetical protein
MSGQIVHHDADQVGVRIMDIRQIAHTDSEVSRGSMLGDLHMTPGLMRVEKHEQIGRAITPILVIIPLGLVRCRRDRFACLADQLGRTFVKANHRM